MIWHDHLDNERAPGDGDSMQGSDPGPHSTNEQIENALRAAGAHYSRLDDAVLMPMLGGLLDADNVVGWFQGRMEFGPHALGARSIIGDPRNARMQATMGQVGLSLVMASTMPSAMMSARAIVPKVTIFWAMLTST